MSEQTACVHLQDVLGQVCWAWGRARDGGYRDQSGAALALHETLTFSTEQGMSLFVLLLEVHLVCAGRAVSMVAKFLFGGLADLAD